MANYAWTISMLAMTIAFITFFTFSATRRRALLVTALASAAIAVVMGCFSCMYLSQYSPTEHRFRSSE